jgi:hypothetical protein
MNYFEMEHLMTLSKIKFKKTVSKNIKKQNHEKYEQEQAVDIAHDKARKSKIKNKK